MAAITRTSTGSASSPPIPIFARHALFTTAVVADPRFTAALSAARRELFDAVVHELVEFANEVQRSDDAERLELIRERKPEMDVSELTEDQRAAFRERSLPSSRPSSNRPGRAERVYSTP